MTFVRGSKYLGGYVTNNQAEYEGLMLGLRAAVGQGFTALDVAGDSQLVCRQITGQYQVNAPGLVPLHSRAMGLVGTFDQFNIRSIPREENRVADALANEAMDRRVGSCR